MADAALKSFEDLLENVPKWIADIQAILRVSTDRQNEMLFEKQPTEAAPIPKKKSKSSSLRSFRSSENTRQKEDKDAKTNTPEPTLLRPQLPHMTESDALRLAQRKRKTESVCSGDQSGPSKYRSRSMVVVYYDGDIQKKFEELVRAVGVCRNGIRKGKMGAKVDGLSRADSSSSEASSGSDGEDASFSLHKLGYKSTRAKPVGRLLLGHKKDATMVFDKVDGLVDKAQSLCEKAAHQILRDGDCKQELETAMQSFDEAKIQAESEIPALRQRVEKAAERERRSDERRRDQEEAEERKRESGRELSGTEKQLTSFPPSDGKLEVDLEADDSDGDDGDFNAGFDLGHFQMRSTSHDPTMEVHRSFLSSLTWRLSRNVTPAALHGTLNRFDYALASDFALDLKFLWRRLAQTSLVSQAICARTQLSPSFAAENSERHVKGAAVARRGPLRDLDPNNVLPTPATQPSLKVANSDDDLAITDEDEASREPPRSTRATRSGRQKVNYDMKYHPMDEVTRPKRAAKRIPASCPPKTSIKIDLETSDASSNIDLDFPSGDDESELESKDSDIELVRKPDPRATRHSARSEARKAVNYSRKHHPQDHGLPGFQRRAKRIKLEHSDAVRKKSYAGGGLDDDDIGNFQQRSDSLKGSDTGVEGHVDEQKGTIDDLPIHSQSLGGSEEGRPDPKLCASFKNDSEAASMEDAGIANSTDNEFAYGDRMNESGVEQFGDMDYLGLFPSETHGNPEVQTSSLAASPKKEMISVEEQVQLNRADASLTIVKPYFSGYQGYVLNPSAVPFELSRATMLDHAPSQPQDFDQPAIGSPFSGADTTSVNGIPKDSQSALKSDQGTAPQASLALTSSACFEESSVNQTRASLSCSSNTLSAVDDSTPGVLAPSLILDDAKEGRGSMQSDIPGSAQPQQPSVEDADVHELFSKYASDTHGSHENGNDLLSPLLLSLGQNGSPAIQATTGDSELPSTCAQSFASAEDANEVPPSGQGDH